MIQQPGNAGIKEIPIPGIIRIPSYQTDYLPVRRERNTYLRPKGACRAAGGGRRGGRRRSGCPPQHARGGSSTFVDINCLQGVGRISAPRVLVCSTSTASRGGREAATTPRASITLPHTCSCTTAAPTLN